MDIRLGGPVSLRSKIALAAVVVLVGCKDDGTGSTDSTDFTQADADAAAVVIAGHPGLPGGGSLALVASLGAPLPIGPGPFTINESVTCPGGGTATITGQGTRTPNQTTRQTTVAWTFAAGHTDCVVRTGANAPSISGTLSGNGTSQWQFPSTPGGEPTMLSYSLTRSGTITFRKGSRTGTCQATLTTSNQGGTTWTTTGTVCDHQVSNNQKPLGMKT
jgi:hypothetical protein